MRINKVLPGWRLCRVAFERLIRPVLALLVSNFAGGKAKRLTFRPHGARANPLG